MKDQESSMAPLKGYETPIQDRSRFVVAVEGNSNEGDVESAGKKSLTIYDIDGQVKLAFDALNEADQNALLEKIAQSEAPAPGSVKAVQRAIDNTLTICEVLGDAISVQLSGQSDGDAFLETLRIQKSMFSDAVLQEHIRQIVIKKYGERKVAAWSQEEFLKEVQAIYEAQMSDIIGEFYIGYVKSLMRRKNSIKKKNMTLKCPDGLLTVPNQKFLEAAQDLQEKLQREAGLANK